MTPSLSNGHDLPPPKQTLRCRANASPPIYIPPPPPSPAPPTEEGNSDRSLPAKFTSYVIGTTMAATVTSAWAKPGAWALEAEAAEEAAVAATNVAQSEPSDFPTLAAAASTKASKKKKKISLAEFTTGQSIAPGTGKAPTRLTRDELLSLPTGPRQHTAEELERRFTDGTRRVARVDAPPREPLPPSRADEIDDWGAMKKLATGPPPAEGSRRERRDGFFFDKQPSVQRADDSDSWISGKAAPLATGRRVEGFKERRGGFEFRGEGGGVEGDTWGRRREEPSSGGGGGRPKLMLQPRTLPLESNVGEQQPEPAKTVKAARGVNPFGEARPREKVLEEKGHDWKKMDEKLESMKIREARPLSRDSSSSASGFGRKVASTVSEDRTDKNWRKDKPDASPTPESSEHVKESAPETEATVKE